VKPVVKLDQAGSDDDEEERFIDVDKVIEAAAKSKQMNEVKSSTATVSNKN